MILVIKHLSQKAAVSRQGEDVYTAHGSQPDSQQACSMGKLFLNSAFIHSLARVCVCVGGTFYSEGQAGEGLDCVMCRKETQVGGGAGDGERK